MAEKLDRLSLVRPIYRALLNKGRTYAAFERKIVLPIVEELADRKEILDPMAGYGLLINYCSELNLSAFCVEYNPPAYLWEILIHPTHTKTFITFTKELEKLRRKWPRTSLRASISSDWYHKESKRIILKLYLLCSEIVENMGLKGKKAEEIILAFLLPFVGRLSACCPGNMTIHVKKGGICVYKGWRDDFSSYIKVLNDRLKGNSSLYKKQCHNVVLGDCRTIKLPNKRFSAMITSPAYPNSSDYFTMFAPENEFLNWLEKEQRISKYMPRRRLIGSVCVSETNGLTKRQPKDVKSYSARKFLRAIKNFKKTKDAEYDNQVYYIPLFSNYFYDLEKAYENVAGVLKKDFEGYIIAVNNTARDQTIPVAECIIETWQRLGFKAEISKKWKPREVFHSGGVNPRARGFKAKHTEYIIKIWRN